MNKISEFWDNYLLILKQHTCKLNSGISLSEVLNKRTHAKGMRVDIENLYNIYTIQVPGEKERLILTARGYYFKFGDTKREEKRKINKIILESYKNLITEYAHLDHSYSQIISESLIELISILSAHLNLKQLTTLQLIESVKTRWVEQGKTLESIYKLIVDEVIKPYYLKYILDFRLDNYYTLRNLESTEYIEKLWNSLNHEQKIDFLIELFPEKSKEIPRNNMLTLIREVYI